jgi:pentatricopeptide repeat protein
MAQDGIRPDEKTYNCLISACAKAALADRAEHWFYKMEMDNCKADNVTFGSVIHAWAKVGHVKRAEFWINKMLSHGIHANIICFNTILRACATQGDTTTALRLFSIMLDLGITPNSSSYNSVMLSYAANHDVVGVEQWKQKMLAAGLQPDKATQEIAQQALSRIAAQQAQQGIVRTKSMDSTASTALPMDRRTSNCSFDSDPKPPMPPQSWLTEDIHRTPTRQPLMPTHLAASIGESPAVQSTHLDGAFDVPSTGAFNFAAPRRTHPGRALCSGPLDPPVYVGLEALCAAAPPVSYNSQMRISDSLFAHGPGYK